MYEAILQFFVLLLVAIITAIYSLTQYFTKKEYEIIIERYLKEGIDLISGYIDKALSIYLDGWERSLDILQKFKITQSSNQLMSEKYYTQEFLRYEQSFFSITPFYKLRSIIGDDIFWHAFQNLVAFVEGEIYFFENDLCHNIRYFIENKQQLDYSFDKLFRRYMKRIRKYDEKGQKYYKMIDELQKISSILEREKFTFKKLGELKNDQQIQEIIIRIKKDFKN